MSQSGFFSCLRLALICLASVSAVAQGRPVPSGLELIEIFIDQRSMNRLADRLDLTEDQRVVIASLREAYEVEIRNLEAVIYDRVLRAAGVTGSGDESWEQVRRLEPEQAAKFTETLQSVVRVHRAESDRLREELLENVLALLTNEQAKGWESAARALRRDVILNLRMDPEGPNSHVNLGMRSDLMRVIETESAARISRSEPPGASRRFGEGRGSLWMLLGEMPLANAPAPFLEVRQRAAEIVEQYEREMEALLMSGAALADQDERAALRAAERGNDVERTRTLHTRLQRTGFTRTVLRINERTSAQLAGLLRELGDTRSADRWEWEVNMVHYPEIYGGDIAAFMIDWMREQLGEDSPLHEMVNGIDETFQRQRKAMYAELVREDRSIREEISVWFPDEAKLPLFDRYFRLRADFEVVKAETLAKLKALAPPEIAARFDRTVEQNRPQIESRYINTIEMMQFRTKRGGVSDPLPSRHN